jgi:hypothetical protein
MELRTNPSIPHAIHLQFKHQPRTLTPHIQREIQIIKLDALCRRQPRKQTLGHRIQIRRKCANVDETFLEGVGRHVGVASDEIVFYNEGLTGSEVARVVEGYGSVFGDLRALCGMLVCCVMDTKMAYGDGKARTFAMCHCIRSDTIHRSQSGLQYRSDMGCFASSKTVA